MDIYNDKQQREIFHILFLERLLKISDSSLFSLKGGVNLRFFFKSPRYSEDMDLDVFGGSVETLKKNGYKVLNDPSFLRVLQIYGISALKINDPTKAKQTETTQRFKLNLINTNGEEFPTKVEFSRRTKPNRNDILNENILPEVMFPYRRLSFTTPHYKSKAAIAQKVQALGGRAEVQARDVFDLYVFYLSGHLNRKIILDNTTPAERKKALSALLELDYSDYRGHVVDYLEEDTKKQFESLKTWEQLSSVIMDFLDESN